MKSCKINSWKQLVKARRALMIFSLQEHKQEREKTRRMRQITVGILRKENGLCV